MKIFVLLVLMALPLPTVAQQAKQAGRCFNIGDSVTVRGAIQSGMNGGTYFLLLEKLCVHYPKQSDRWTPNNLETIGEKLPPDVYLEVTGELRDPWPSMGVGIKVVSFRNVAKEVEAERGQWRQSCEQWQDEKIPELRDRTHGAKVVRITQDLPPELNCGISAADTKLPHELITIHRAEPKP
jgi:hypothetical protein